MFGRKCDVIHLLNPSKTCTTYPSEQSSDDESIQREPQVDPYFKNTQTDTDDVGDEIKFFRKQNETEARLIYN